MIELFQNERAFLWVGSGLYLLAFLYALLQFSRGQRYHSSILYLMLLCGFALQSTGLYMRGLALHAFPLTNLLEIIQVIGWSSILIELILRPAFKLRLLGFFASALAGVLGLLSLSITSWDAIHTTALGSGNPWVGFHAALAIFSYGVFGVLALTALMYLIQHYALQRKKIGGLSAYLPSVKQLDDINGRLLLIGVAILSVAVVTGFVNWLQQPNAVGAAKLIAAVILWFGYLTAYFLRSRKRLIASQFAWSCVLLFLFALLSLWPVKLDIFVNNAENPAPALAPDVR